MLEGLRILEKGNVVYDEVGNVEKSTITYQYKEHFVLRIITRMGESTFVTLPKNSCSPIADINLINGKIYVKITHMDFQNSINPEDIDEYYQNACILKELTDYIEVNYKKLQEGDIL